jgi:2-haloacid dehalogenase
MIKAIIFDYGNVLLDWDPRRIFQRYFPEDPGDVDTFLSEIRFMDWHKHQDKGRSFAEAIEERSAQFPEYAHILPAYDKHWDDSIAGPIEGTVEILRKLKQAGYPLYGLSNYSAEKFPEVRKKYEFFNWFSDMLISGQVGVIKPDPAIFRLLLAKIGRTPDECIFIDDSGPNINCARALGFITIQFDSPQQLEQKLQELGILQSGKIEA